MAAPQNHWKLGLFVVAGLALVLATVAFIGARSMRKDVGLYVSYFDESVQGLEVGSPIKFRGVTIGYVGKIEVAPDHRHVMVESELGVAELARLGLDIAKDEEEDSLPPKLEMSAGLRLQLASSGLTGVKFLQLDFFDVATNPLPKLPFPVPKNYIPTVPSMMKGLEDSLILIANRLPEIIEQTASIMSGIDLIVRDVHDRKLPKQIAVTVKTLNDLLSVTKAKIARIDTEALSREAQQMLATIDAAADRLEKILVRIDREGGLLTSVERASGSVGDTLRDADGLGGRLMETLEAVQTSAQQIRRFMEALEQDPDMLLKGRKTEEKR